MLLRRQRFGTAIADPAKAPAFFHLAGSVDTANLPSGSEWSIQGIELNTMSSSTRSTSVTNSVLFQTE